MSTYYQQNYPPHGYPVQGYPPPLQYTETQTYVQSPLVSQIVIVRERRDDEVFCCGLVGGAFLCCLCQACCIQ